MSQLDLTTMMGTRASMRLDHFEAETHHRVAHQIIPWNVAWDQLQSISLHNTGPDVSHIGNTWLGSLTGMEALHPFSPDEIAQIGGSDIFVPSVWQTVHLSDHPGEVYAIPWTAGTCILVYRRDRLAEAGINEASAFSSIPAFENTLARLHQCGDEHPLAFPTVRNAAHFTAPWVWSHGGDLRASNQRHLALTEPRTLEALHRFFRLHPYTVPNTHGLSYEDVSDLFRTDRLAIAYTTHHLAVDLILRTDPIFGRQNVGVAKVPGTPFLGGNSLIIWRHSIYEEAAVDLIRHLLAAETQVSLYQQGVELPVRVDVLSREPFSQHPAFTPIIESLQAGRAFHSSYHWATVEKRFNAMFGQLWIDLFNDRTLDPVVELERRLIELQNRLEKSILNVSSG
jgi:ABC-type glycerol-3-phosphate transport system substrate-binding protein